MTRLTKFAGNFFSDLFHDSSVAYYIQPLHGESLKSDFLVDVRERNGAYIVHAELPGVKKEDVVVKIDGDCFTISAKIEQYDQKSEDEKVVQSERYLGSVSRTICLPIEIDKSSSTANFENGILELMLSKGKIKENNELKIK